VPAPSQLLTRLSRALVWLRRASNDGLCRLAFFTILAVVVMWPQLGTTDQLNLYQDSHQHTLFEEAARLSVARFHEPPLWDPYFCGGISGFGTPSARFLSPTFILSLLFGTLRGAVLTLVIMTILGMEGTFRYARSRGGGALGAMVAAPVFALSGVFAHASLVAWVNFFGFELAPWSLLGLRLALRGSRRGLVITGLATSWMIGFGGTYTGPLTLLGAGFEALAMLVESLRRPHLGRRIAIAVPMAVIVGLLTASLAMIRLWPIAENLAASPRLLGGLPGTTPLAALKHLFGDKGNHFTKGDFFIGLGVVPVMLFGFVRKKSWALIVGMLLWLWFSTGYKVSVSLFGLLRHVPPYTMLRAPERFLVFVGLAAAVIAAIGIRRVEVAVKKRGGRWVVVAFTFVALLLADAGVLVRLGQSKADARKMEMAPLEVNRSFAQTRGNRWMATYFPMMSRGSLTCFDDYDVVQSTDLRGDLPAEEYLRDADAGTVKRVRWAPSRIDLSVDLTRPARVYVNQNWHPGWRSNVGTVVAENDLLAVDMPAGPHALTLRFWPRSSIAGMDTTLVALLAVGFILWQAKKKDSVDSAREVMALLALSAAPLLIVPLALKLMPEPKRPDAPLMTPEGEPMVVDAAPSDTTPLGARIEDGVFLDASHVQYFPKDEDHGPEVTLELDWRFTEKVPPGLGIFVQFEHKKNHFALDHVLLSGAVTPESAPLNTVLRDVSDPIVLPEVKEPGTWKVWAGFWRARRDMSRMKVLDPGKATVNKDRVLVGQFDDVP
jgi:hypothetical protein